MEWKCNGMEVKWNGMEMNGKRLRFLARTACTLPEPVSSLNTNSFGYKLKSPGGSSTGHSGWCYEHI